MMRAGILTVLAITASPVVGAGIGVHTEVGKRALDLYQNEGELQIGGRRIRDIVDEHQDAFQVRTL